MGAAVGADMMVVVRRQVHGGESALRACVELARSPATVTICHPESAYTVA